MIPSFRYPGMKSSLRPWLVSYFPKDIRCYCEPFAGRANVFFLVAARQLYATYWLNDMRTNTWLAALLDADPFKLPEKITAPQARVWQARALDGDPLARVLETSITYCGIGFEEKGTLTASAYSRKSFQSRLVYAKLALTQRSGRITGERFDAMDLETLGGSDFVYLDPPYHGVSVGAYYSDDLDHEAMLRRLKAAPYPWVLSNYPNELYEDHLGPPAATKLTRRKGLGGVHGSDAVEAIWRHDP